MVTSNFRIFFSRGFEDADWTEHRTFDELKYNFCYTQWDLSNILTCTIMQRHKASFPFAKIHKNKTIYFFTLVRFRFENMSKYCYCYLNIISLRADPSQKWTYIKKICCRCLVSEGFDAKYINKTHAALTYMCTTRQHFICEIINSNVSNIRIICQKHTSHCIDESPYVEYNAYTYI